jgi:hypothetical protein
VLWKAKKLNRWSWATSGRIRTDQSATRARDDHLVGKLSAQGRELKSIILTANDCHATQNIKALFGSNNQA